MKHGVSAYNRGCRCPTCTEASRVRVAEYTKRVHLNRGPLRVDATGTRRRIQALAAIGWSFSEQARRAGVSVQTMHAYTLASTTTPRVRERVRGLYDDLSSTPGPSRYARTVALRNGWPRPIDWDDDMIDDPTCQPFTETTCDDQDDVDEIAVDRFIAGDLDWRTLTKQERLTAAVQMDRLGYSRNVIAERVHIRSQVLWATFRDAAEDVAS